MKRVQNIVSTHRNLQKLRAVIIELLPTGHPTIEQAADVMGISVRTLQRQLHAIELCYRELVEQIRMEQACIFLDSSDLNLAELAQALGYTDPSSFSRAFRRWKSISPRDYRKSHRI